MIKSQKGSKLYLVASPEPSLNRSSLDVALAGIKAGVTYLQLRDKLAQDQDLISLGTKISQAAKSKGTTFIINDRIDLALATGADGVHLGQEDMSVKAAKKIAPDLLVGVSAHNLEQALEAQKQKADYISVGPVFHSPTKPDIHPIGLPKLKEIVEKVGIPVVAIGGITVETVSQVVNTGVDFIAVISAINNAPDMIKATFDLQNRITEASNGRFN